jgi:hypothetical protein
MLYVLFLVQQQRAIRHRMKERLEQQSLHTIILPDNSIQWVKPEKEILVNGKMFDIKRAEHKGSVTVFHGLYDEEETALNKRFNKDWNKDTSGQNQLLVKLFKCLRGFYFVTTSEEEEAAPRLQHITAVSTPRLLSQFKTIITPPPQV